VPPEQEAQISVPPDTLARIRLQYAQVFSRAAAGEIRVPGTIQPNAYRQTRVIPLVGGVVTQISAELGQTVQRGQSMAQIFSQELASAETALVAATTELEVEHKKLARTQDLVRLGAASREELEGVEGAHQVHTAHVAEARQRLLQLGRSEEQIDRGLQGGKLESQVSITAPGDGVITERNVNVGQVVMVSQDLFTVTDLSSVWAEASVLENDLGAIRLGSHAAITTPAYGGRGFQGKVAYIDPNVDPQTRTAKVRVELNNSQQILKLGMYVEVAIGTVPGTPQPAIPSEAIQLLGSKSVVYLPVKGEDGRFVQRAVKPTGYFDGGVTVAGDITQGETVVTMGSSLLRAEAVRQGLK